MSRFSKITSRKGTRSVKWDYAEELYQDKEVLPMWVADMDFEAPEAVIKALKHRVEHGIFGYTMPDDLLKDQINTWLKKRHDWEIENEWITYSPGVIPSLHMIVQALTEKDDSIIIQTPVYPPFYSVIKDHGRKLVENPLNYIDEYYSIDFEDFEEKIKKNNVKLFILCNPHNPVGRVWTKDELQKMSDICLRHGVKIISDEIHADLIFDQRAHIPIASLSKETNDQVITLMSPTKTFNLAGLQASYLVTANEELRQTVKKQFDNQGIFMLNTLGMTAMEAAYSEGEEWLEELLQTLEANRDYVMEKFHSETSSIRVVPTEGTYLLWLDCRALNLTHTELKSFMQKQAKVGLNDGGSFGEEGQGFMRINIAAPHELIEDGVNRIIEAVQKLKLPS
ncbi:PatB family C-S lyase [Halobacillus sp. A1]|uniref:MalY/PatB family protein n=1 Tax=Halobacillus sp. A1 TaxID=2880262 RepID=UPI0020A6D692|nr:PatB family C-S lyase [Halobacillus sp. A1]MCP3032771.1 PatB family C-S lyase [Halobacillus sp. A1]